MWKLGEVLGKTKTGKEFLEMVVDLYKLSKILSVVGNIENREDYERLFILRESELNDLQNRWAKHIEEHPEIVQDLVTVTEETLKKGIEENPHNKEHFAPAIDYARSDKGLEEATKFCLSGPIMWAHDGYNREKAKEKASQISETDRQYLNSLDIDGKLQSLVDAKVFQNYYYQDGGISEEIYDIRRSFLTGGLNGRQSIIDVSHHMANKIYREQSEAKETSRHIK